MQELKEKLEIEKEDLKKQLIIYKSEDPLSTSDRKQAYSLGGYC